MKLISRYDLKQMLDEQQDFMLLNVLSNSSYLKLHIPASQNVPISEPDFVRQVESLLAGKGSDYPIVTYCAGFHCSASKDAANLLQTAGHTNVSVFEGGMEDWQEALFPLVSTDVTPCEEHCSH